MENPEVIQEESIIPPMLPAIYSKRAILRFSIFFSTVVGAVLLMQNLRDIGKKREGNIVISISILYTVLSMIIISIPDKPYSSLTYLCNILGAFVMTEYFYKKYFPDEAMYNKKKIWKPLIISLLIIIPLALAAFFLQPIQE